MIKIFNFKKLVLWLIISRNIVPLLSKTHSLCVIFSPNQSFSIEPNESRVLFFPLFASFLRRLFLIIIILIWARTRNVVLLFLSVWTYEPSAPSLFLVDVQRYISSQWRPRWFIRRVYVVRARSTRKIHSDSMDKQREQEKHFLSNIDNFVRNVTTYFSIW